MIRLLITVIIIQLVFTVFIIDMYEDIITNIQCTPRSTLAPTIAVG